MLADYQTLVTDLVRDDAAKQLADARAGAARGYFTQPFSR